MPTYFSQGRVTARSRRTLRSHAAHRIRHGELAVVRRLLNIMVLQHHTSTSHTMLMGSVLIGVSMRRVSYVSELPWNQVGITDSRT